MSEERRYLTDEERYEIAKGYAARIPDKFLEIDHRARDAWSGFFHIGESEAGNELRNGILNRLHDAGWPVTRMEGWDYKWDAGTKSGGPVNRAVWELVTNMTDPATWTSMALTPMLSAKQRRHSFGSSLSFEKEGVEEALDFIAKPENLAALDKAVEDSIAELEPKYGNPFTQTVNRKAGLTAIFNALREHKPFSYLNGFRSPEEQDAAYKEFRLIKVLKNTLLPLMRHFNDGKDEKWVPGLEFQGRLEEYLEAWYGWKLRGDDNDSRALRETLWGLASAAEEKTTIPVRFALQDTVVPPRPSQRRAKDFILEHIDEIETAAIKGVTVELNKELASPEGLVTRHCRVGDRPYRVPPPPASLGSGPA